MKKVKGEERMVKKAVRVLYQNRSEGDILMDAPDTERWEDLVEMGKDKNEWRL